MSNQYHSGQKIIFDKADRYRTKPANTQIQLRSYSMNKKTGLDVLIFWVFNLYTNGRVFAHTITSNKTTKEVICHLNPYTSLIRMIDFISLFTYKYKKIMDPETPFSYRRCIKTIPFGTAQGSAIN